MKLAYFVKYLLLVSITLFIFLIKRSGAGNYNYGQVLARSLLFYEAQRSGRLPPDNRIPWRGDTFLNDKADTGENLSGGYFDGGDTMKFGFPMAFTTTMMGWGLLDYSVGYDIAGQLKRGLDALKWATDYFVKAHHHDTNSLVVQVGNPAMDHEFWGRPEDYPATVARPAYKVNMTHPGSDVAAETAAAFAVASMVFNRSGNFDYAGGCLNRALQLYNFAKRFRGRYSDSVPSVQPYYKSWTGFGDELAWAAAWLYRATLNPTYLDDVEDYWERFGLYERPAEFSWDDKTVGFNVLMARLNVSGSDKYLKAAKEFCDWAVLEAPKTGKGLVFISYFGTLQHAANVAFACLHLAPAFGTAGRAYQNFAKQQIDYILGDSGRSFVVGFGTGYPKQPRHAASSCPNPPNSCTWKTYSKKQDNVHILYGALVGGPGKKDKYDDKRSDTPKSDVNIAYNAGFQIVLAALNTPGTY